MRSEQRKKTLTAESELQARLAAMSPEQRAAYEQKQAADAAAATKKQSQMNRQYRAFSGGARAKNSISQPRAGGGRGARAKARKQSQGQA